MRRKLFVLAMTLSLVLSFMPFMAFADTETESPAPVSEAAEIELTEEGTAADDQEVSAEDAESPEQTEPETSGPDAEPAEEAAPAESFKLQALNAGSGTCSHKNVYTEESRDWDSASYTSIDNTEHTVSGPVEVSTWCEDCGALVKTATVNKKEKDYHTYENNVCIDCGHKNSCKHAHTSTEYEWDEDDVSYTSVDNKFHRVRGAGEKVTYCEDCEAEISSVSATINELYCHTYENNVCIDCGHKNSCKHTHTYTEREWDEDAVSYTALDKAMHRVKGKGTLTTYCEDCGAMISSKAATIDDEACHDFDSNHVCRDCGYRNACKHPSTYVEYEYDDESCTIVDLKDKGHKVTGIITKNTYCRECEELIKTEELGKTTVTEPHYYDIGDVCTYCGHHWGPADTRIYGKKRYDTSVEIAERSKDSTAVKFDNIIVAYGQNFPDALSGGYLAKVKNAPILLVEPSEENRIADYIGKNLASGGRVYILGGTGVVSSDFEGKVKAKGITTERLGGQTRYETNLAILKAAGVKDQDILVCTGTGYADSLSASAVGKPILLVGSSLTAEQRSYLKGLGTKQFYLIGGTGVVRTSIEKELTSINRAKIERLWGQTRYETSVAVAKKFFSKTKTVLLAYAQNFPDGLSGGPLALIKNAPIILTDSKTIAPAREYVKSAGAVRSITLGGPTLISDIAVRAIMGR